MSPMRLALLISWWLLTPTLAWSGTGDTRTSVLPDAPVAPQSVRLMTEPGATEVPGSQSDTWHDEAARPDVGLRILAELGMGVAGGLVGAVAGSLVVVALPCHSGGVILACTFDFVVGAFLGWGVGVPLGVWLGGRLTQGHGSLLFTLLASSVGLAVSLGLSAVASGGSAAAIALVTLPIVLSITTYEITDAWRTPASQPSREGLQLSPLLAATAGGALLGLGGRF